MGYYNGSGVTVGGSDNITILTTALVGTVLNVLRREKKTSVVKRGVNLSSAQAASSSMSIVGGDVTWGIWRYPVPIRNGTVVRTSYSQISDSNLYELVTETTEFHSKLNSGNWDS